MTTATTNDYGFTDTDAAIAAADDNVGALLRLCRRDDPRDIQAAIRLRERTLAESPLTPAQRTAAYLMVTEAAYAQLAHIGAEGPTKCETVRV